MRTAMKVAVRPLKGVLISLLAILGCERTARESTTPAKGDPQPKAPRHVLVFPEELRTGDASVDSFIAEALEACSPGQYDKFRSLWSAREEPISSSEFEEGWQAIHELRIRALRKVRLEIPSKIPNEKNEIVEHFAVLAEAKLDPKHPAAGREPVREVALLLVRENETWRLARAPENVRAWLKKQTETPPG